MRKKESSRVQKTGDITKRTGSGFSEQDKKKNGIPSRAQGWGNNVYLG